MATEGAARILVVGDSRQDREAFASVLSGAGYRVGRASNGVEGLAVLTGEPFGLVVSDLVMPLMGGLELLQALHCRRDRLPVIIVTGHHESQPREEAMALGASAYLHKPVEIAELLATVKQVLDAAPCGLGASPAAGAAGRTAPARRGARLPLSAALPDSPGE